MPGLYKDEGVVLKTIKLGESDRIVTLFTRSNGKVRAVAKGVRKTKSRFGGRLEPFTRVQLLIYQGRNLDTITSADIITSFDEVRTDLSRLLSASAMVELVEKITPERERAGNVYGLLLSGLTSLTNGGGPSVVPAFMVKLLSISGYHPQLRACAGCGNGTELIAFSAALGGAVCGQCIREDSSAVLLSSDRVRLLGVLLASDFGSGGDQAAADELTGALKSYAEYHLERPLRSLRFLNYMPPAATHVAIIMDGNGRWAEARGLARTRGHEAGERALFDVVEGSLEAGLRYLSVYAFSTENWARPSEEVNFLLSFNRMLLRARRDQLNERGVKIRRIGRREGVPADVLDEFGAAEELTASNRRMDLLVCFNYGGRAEIEDAAVLGTVADNLYAPDVPDVDLLIRTSGEKRLSNFLLWQSAYAELYFTETLWPDFDRHALFSALEEYRGRKRRFGGL